ncbi:hypothetical protein [Bradyrhizobium sp. JYMT SZCCT0428]|uniref:hypothetical protein n=1 Tax=Bradyrhizobium sp. JYMT SZCCT0428 TaxID=2807673 RepID=UPI001BA72AC0|nr:hypothetical protein [Bradyrhizobium sp. JYMT SZCCT0428]MBR1149417.1 hypothetical protein [Bradyrhizobium sp. JYMT SZCCT0428]
MQRYESVAVEHHRTDEIAPASINGLFPQSSVEALAWNHLRFPLPGLCHVNVALRLTVQPLMKAKNNVDRAFSI